MSKDLSYSRCTACDRPFYPSWRREINEFEELCWNCKGVAMFTARVDPVMYGSGGESSMINPMKWEQSPSEELGEYLDTLSLEERGNMDESLYTADEWMTGVAGDTGDWVGGSNPFDNYEV